MPQWLGAIDGKHIAKKTRAYSSLSWDNYKGYFDMVPLAICDAHYNFTAVDIGQSESNNDCHVLLKYRMCRKCAKFL